MTTLFLVSSHHQWESLMLVDTYFLSVWILHVYGFCYPYSNELKFPRQGVLGDFYGHNRGRDRDGSPSSIYMTGSIFCCYHDRLFLSHTMLLLVMSSWSLQTQLCSGGFLPPVHSIGLFCWPLLPRDTEKAFQDGPLTFKGVLMLVLFGISCPSPSGTKYLFLVISVAEHSQIPCKPYFPDLLCDCFLRGSLHGKLLAAFGCTYFNLKSGVFSPYCSTGNDSLHFSSPLNSFGSQMGKFRTKQSPLMTLTLLKPSQQIWCLSSWYQQCRNTSR